MADIPETEPIDHVAGQRDVTAWRRAARRHQNRWRETNGWPAGTQRRSKQQGGGSRLIGSRLEECYAIEHGANFLDDAIRRAVDHRIAHPQPLQTLDETRLRCDLLSSMPMCFNLLGPLWADPELATAVTHCWFPDLCPLDATVEVDFEWSPGRRDPRWLDDRTAFDAVLQIRAGDRRHLIGVETKYHEYPIVEPLVRRRRGIEQPPRTPKKRYIDVTNQAGLFDDPAWLKNVWARDVEQVWRDHLLALACQLQSPDDTDAHYVLVAPEGNPAWSHLAQKYTQLLAPPGAATFQYRSLENLLDLAGDVLPQAGAFQARYLDIAV